MIERKREGLSAEQKVDLWSRWKAGQSIPGHGEGDRLRGAGNSLVATLVERHSRFCMVVKAPGKDSSTVVAALSQHGLGTISSLERP